MTEFYIISGKSEIHFSSLAAAPCRESEKAETTTDELILLKRLLIYLQLQCFSLVRCTRQNKNRCHISSDGHNRCR